MACYVYRVLLLCVLSVGLASATLAQPPLWRPYTELEGRAGGQREQGQFNLFFPLWQDQGSMLFLDARGYQDDKSAAEGNWGLAYRTILPSEWVFGVNGFFDYRRTEFGNSFSQGAFGVELLDVNCGFRFNGYVPDGEVQTAASASRAVLSGNSLVVHPGLESAYKGFDLEAEHLMWFRDGSSSSIDMEIWAAAGLFHFDNSSSGFESITGPRLRTELRTFDLPLLSNDSRLVFAGQYEYDDVRGSQGTGMIAVRIPFGPGGGRKGRLSGLARRMVAPIERDINIVTNTALGPAEQAKIARTGQAITQVVTIDATTFNPQSVVAGAGSNSVVIADGSEGTIFTTGLIRMNQGQVLIGGGAGLAIVGHDTGAAATFHAPGTRPTIDIATSITMSNHSLLSGLNIMRDSGSVILFATPSVFLSDDTNVLINNVHIDTSGSQANAIISSGSSQFVVSNSTITTNGGIGIDSRDDSQFTVNNSTIITKGYSSCGVVATDNSQFTLNDSSITTNGQSSAGIFSSHNSRFTLNNLTITTNGDAEPIYRFNSEAIYATDNSQFVVNAGRITTTGLSTNGITIDSNSQTIIGGNPRFRLQSVSINASGNGIFLNDDFLRNATVDATITDSSITAGVGFDEILARTDGVAVQNLHFSGNALNSGAGTIRLDEVSGMINVSQTAPGSDANSIDVLNGIPAANVLIPGGPINFGQPAPPTP